MKDNMEIETFAICSNVECNYSTPFTSAPFRIDSNTLFDPTWFGGESKNLFCELCGSKLFFYCPHCGKGLFTIPNATHCRHCGKKIKPGKYDHLGTTINVDEGRDDK